MITALATSPAPRSAPPVVGPATRIHGMHKFMSMAYRGQDLTPILQDLSRRITNDEDVAAAMLDLSLVLQSLSCHSEARAMLSAALDLQRDYCVVHGDGSGPHILAMVTAGDFMANIPVDLLLSGSNVVLWLRYLDGGPSDLDALPAHDTALLAVAEGNDNGPILQSMAGRLAGWPDPVLNCNAGLIDRLTRDEVSRLLANEPSIVSPRTYRATRAHFHAVLSGELPLGSAFDGLDYPMIIRPIGTHAGDGLEKITADAELRSYLAAQPGDRFYVAPFIDYRDADGRFVKQRIAFIKGRPFASHMALSEHWMVHYLSAGMADSAGKRAIEQRWMETFDTEFVARQAHSMAALTRIFDLDYFGIDCAELPDGRLLVFELSVAMGVHDMDDEETFPYKKVAMRKLFDAFIDMAAGA